MSKEIPRHDDESRPLPIIEATHQFLARRGIGAIPGHVEVDVSKDHDPLAEVDGNLEDRQVS